VSAQNFLWVTKVNDRFAVYNAFPSDDVWIAPPPRAPLWVGETQAEAISWAEHWSVLNTAEYGIEVDRELVG
jgi:hypothetical protein